MKRSLNTSNKNDRAKRLNIEDQNTLIKNESDESAMPSPASTLICQNGFTRSGKVIRVHMRNFMCHKNLSFDFNESVNIVVGTNGSGKSAILTALIIGLGGKAIQTNRTNSIKQLIKMGETSATIEIHLANNGIDSYEPNVYGDKIITSRYITVSGASSYKIKSNAGHIVSTDRKDLLRILMYFNIQVDNPISILTQDAARSFLKESDPEKQYLLFLKATQIENILQTLNECGIQYKTAKEQLHLLEASTNCLAEKVATIQKKYDRLQSIDYIKVEVKKLRNELIWVKIGKNQIEFDQIKKVFKEKSEYLQSIKNMVQNKQNIRKNIEQSIVDATQNFNKKRCLIKAENDKYSDMRKELPSKSEAFLAEARCYKRAKANINRIEREIFELEKEIETRSKSDTNLGLKLRTANEEKIASLKIKNEQTLKKQANAERDIDLLFNAIGELEDGYEEGKKKKNEYSSKRDKLLSQIKVQSNDNLSVYGQRMPALLAAIKTEVEKNNFSKPPRGPIGKYIEVPNREWRGIIETMLGGFINGFCVNSDKDRILLDRIAKRVAPDIRMTIITGKFNDRPIDYSSGEVAEQDNTWKLVDIIKVSDVVVRNTIIEQQQIESVLLTHDQELAANLTSDINSVPKNLSKVVISKPPGIYHPAPMFRTYALKLKPCRYIQVNLAEFKKQLEEQISQLQSQITDTETTCNKLHCDIKEKTELLNQKKKSITNFQRLIDQNTKEIFDLTNFDYPTEIEIDMLEKELSEQKRILVEEKSEMAVKKNQCDKAEELLKEFENNLDQQKTLIKTKELSLREDESNIKTLESDLHKHDSKVMNSEKDLTRLIEVVAKLQKECDESQGKLDKQIANAKKVSQEPCTSNRTVEDLEELIQLKSLKISRITETEENIELVLTQLNEAVLQLNDKTELIEVIKSTLSLLQKSRMQRFVFIKYLREHMSLRVKNSFIKIMSLRKFTGDITIDHKNRKLEMTIIPRDDHLANAVSNTKSLSGGERSFSTIAFLLSLWSCADHPFYFLDEYDVFTDQVNRHTIMRLLFSEAESKPHRQYIFLTPQDMSNYHSKKTIAVWKMQDPNRK